MRATPPSRRMSAGTRSSAITAQAPASSAIRACSGVTTSMMTPPFSISARPRLTGKVPVVCESISTSVPTTPTAPAGGLPERTRCQVSAPAGMSWRRRRRQLHPRAAGRELDRRALGRAQRIGASSRVRRPVCELAVAHHQRDAVADGHAPRGCGRRPSWPGSRRTSRRRWRRWPGRRIARAAGRSGSAGRCRWGVVVPAAPGSSDLHLDHEHGLAGDGRAGPTVLEHRRRAGIAQSAGAENGVGVGVEVVRARPLRSRKQPVAGGSPRRLS